jgi:hypothetical protein
MTIAPRMASALRRHHERKADRREISNGHREGMLRLREIDDVFVNNPGAVRSR